MSELTKIVALILVAIVFAAFVFGVQTAILFYSWNHAIAPVFDMTAITTVQAACFVMVINIVGACFRSSTSKS